MLKRLTERVSSRLCNWTNMDWDYSSNSNASERQANDWDTGHVTTLHASTSLPCSRGRPTTCEWDLKLHFMLRQVHLVCGEGQRLVNGTWDYNFNKSILSEWKGNILWTWTETTASSRSCMKGRPTFGERSSQFSPKKKTTEPFSCFHTWLTNHILKTRELSEETIRYLWFLAYTKPSFEINVKVYHLKNIFVLKF